LDGAQILLGLAGSLLTAGGAFVGVVRTLSRVQALQEKDKDQLGELQKKTEENGKKLSDIAVQISGLSVQVTGLQGNLGACQDRDTRNHTSFDIRLRDLEKG